MLGQTRATRLFVIGLVCCGVSGELYGRDSNSPEANSSGQIKSDHRSAYHSPSTIRAVENEDKTSYGQKGAGDAEQRQRDELAAQQRSASAAELSAAAAQESAQFSMFGSLFGLISVFLLAWTLWFTRSTAQAASTSARAAEVSAGAAIENTGIARKALDHSQASFELSRRPLIAFDSFPVVYTEGVRVDEVDGTLCYEGPAAIVRGILKNYGASPSSNTSIHFQVLRFATGSTPKMPMMVEGFGSSIAQGQSGSTSAQHVSKAEWDDARAGKLEIYAFGIISYKDSLTDKLHRTSIGFQLQPRLDFDSAASAAANGIEMKSLDMLSIDEFSEIS